jgi:FkbM family methyltransferase
MAGRRIFTRIIWLGFQQLKKGESKMSRAAKILTSLLRKIKRRIFPSSACWSKTFSQVGEDMIVKVLLAKIEKPDKLTWLDIGAHHPTFLSNTALFYSQGKRGVNIEANPLLIQEFYRKRKRDINLNIAIADKSGTMDFYVMDVLTLSTLSSEEAHRYEKLGHKIAKVIPVETKTITDIIDEFCEGKFPDFLSLDAEGYDLEILKMIDYEKSSPKIICVENVPYNTKLRNYFDSMQINELSRFLISKNYSIIAFTMINTIFVRNDFIERG